MVIKIKSVDGFKRLMWMKGFSQRKLAVEAGISDTHLNQIANGAKNPGPVTAKKICDALDVGFDEIFFIEDDNKSYQNNSA